MRHVRSSGILIALVVVGAAGVARTAPPESEAAIRTRLGREAVKAGKIDAARSHWLAALALDRSHLPAWSELAALDATDADAKALWALDAAYGTTDAVGRPKTPFPAPLLAADLTRPFELAWKRMQLAKAVVEAAGKLSGGGGVVVAKWLRLLAAETAAGLPARDAIARTAVERALEKCRPDATKTSAALLAVLHEAKAAGNSGRAVEAARLLVGLAMQRKGASSEKGSPAEIMGPRFALDEARTALKEKAPAPIPFEELAKLRASDTRRAFEDAHASWSDPIVATSAKGRYRIESICGLDTTREAADLVELCHDRLVKWCGKDPFVGKPGVVRLCATPADLDAEGTPYWWAQGFQSGDVTTVVVQWSTGNDLAQLLAHELTHRFDGSLHPRLPAWALEGRANYVAATTPYARADALDERVVDAGQLAEACRWGGYREGLEDVFQGKDPEYRHNYPVGYGIWTFLSRWTGEGKPPDGTPPYRARIPALVAALEASPGAPLRAIESSLCDGREGRASSLVFFEKQVGDFLRGFYSDVTPPWAREWIDRSAGADADRGDYPLTDRSNAPTLRSRLDPPAEGEALAAAAAALLEAAGKASDAIEAHALADFADELDPARYRRAGALETAGGRKEAAFARRRLLARVEAVPAEASKYDLGALAGVLSAATPYLDAVAKASADASAAARPRTARALRAEHDAIARLVGRDELLESGLEAPPPLPAGSAHGAPDCPPAINPLAGGVVEERWSAQEDGALGGPYRLPSPDELELGRTGSAVVTGEDRDARWLGVAVRTVETYAGTYGLRTRVRPAGAYVHGRVIVGWTRRDRGVEVTFTAGDRKAAEKTGESVAGGSGAELTLSDLRPIDGRVTTLYRHIGISDAQGERAGFDLAIFVSGPYVRVQADGKDVLSLRRATGEPVDGSIGFAADRGRTLFSEMRVERHRVLGTDAACRCDRFDAPLTLGVPARFSWSSLAGRRVVGLPPSPHVRLLLWSTGLSPLDPSGAENVAEALSACRIPFERYEYPLDVHVFVKGERVEGGPLVPPASFPKAEALSLEDDHLHAHGGFPGLDTDAENIPQSYNLGWPHWGAIFVDPAGIARTRGPIDDIVCALRLARYVEGR